MGRIGFIDLNSKESGDIYVFKGRPGNYEFEKSIEFGDTTSSYPINADISDFYLSLPLDLLNFRILKLPFSDRERLMKIVPFELESLTMESSDNLIFDVLVLGGSGDTFDVLVTYIERETFKNILAKLASLHIDPRTVTSLELQSVAKGPKEDFASRLLNPEKLDRDERTAAAKNELSANTINLRMGPFAYTKDIEKGRKTLRVTVALLFLLALMIDSYLAFGIIASRNESASIKRELRKVYTGRFPEDKRITDELYQMKSHMREMKEKGDALIGVYPLRFLLELSQRTMPGAAFNEISLDKDLFTMKGEANSMVEIDAMKKRLSEFLSDVSVSDIKPSISGKNFFTVVAKGYKTSDQK